MDIINYLKTGTMSTVLIILGVLGLFLLPGFLTSFGAIVANVGFGIFILYLVDKYALDGINTVDEIKKGNLAYALLLLAIAIVIAASISAS